MPLAWLLVRAAQLGQGRAARMLLLPLLLRPQQLAPHGVRLTGTGQRQNHGTVWCECGQAGARLGLEGTCCDDWLVVAVRAAVHHPS